MRREEFLCPHSPNREKCRPCITESENSRVLGSVLTKKPSPPSWRFKNAVHLFIPRHVIPEEITLKIEKTLAIVMTCAKLFKSKFGGHNGRAVSVNIATELKKLRHNWVEDEEFAIMDEDYNEMVTDIIEHGAVLKKMEPFLIENYANVPESVRYDADSFLDWLEKNCPDALTKKYKDKAAKFIETLKEEFRLHIVTFCETMKFHPPKDEKEMSKKQIRILYDLGFTAIDLLVGKGYHQTQFIINYWTAMKEYIDAVCASFYSEYFKYDVDFTWDDSAASLHMKTAIIGNDGKIHCYACECVSADGLIFKRKNCPICGSVIRR